MTLSERGNGECRGKTGWLTTDHGVLPKSLRKTASTQRRQRVSLRRSARAPPGRRGEQGRCPGRRRPRSRPREQAPCHTPWDTHAPPRPSRRLGVVSPAGTRARGEGGVTENAFALCPWFPSESFKTPCGFPRDGSLRSANEPLKVEPKTVTSGRASCQKDQARG